MTQDLQQRLLLLEAEVRRLKEIVMITAPQSGRTRSYHEPVEMDGYFGRLSQILAHGNWAVDAENKVNKAMLRVGASSLYCMDETGKTGPLGVSKGVIGRFLSQVDSVPAGTTVEVPS